MFDQIRILFPKNSHLSGSAPSHKFVISYGEVLSLKKCLDPYNRYHCCLFSYRRTIIKAIMGGFQKRCANIFA